MDGETRNCFKCKKDSLFKLSHYRTGSDGVRRRVFMDEQGHFWAGRVCPQCVSKYGHKKKRGLLRIKKTNRKCNICGKPLPASRYFNHQQCLANRVVEYHDIYADYQYHTWKSGG